MLNVATREEKECSGPLLNYVTKVCLIDNRKTYLNGNLWEPSREFLRERDEYSIILFTPSPPPSLLLTCRIYSETKKETKAKWYHHFVFYSVMKNRFLTVDASTSYRVT